ncbi:MAG: hypothetical protein IMZ66_11230 [Planctomycetes bacterium]|nr:hypothetical protein [Planctomycetota bacterium]
MTTAEQIAALEARIPYAGMTIQEGDRRTTYPPLAELLAAIDRLKGSAAAVAGSSSGALPVAVFGVKSGDGK